MSPVLSMNTKTNKQPKQTKNNKKKNKQTKQNRKKKKTGKRSTNRVVDGHTTSPQTLLATNKEVGRFEVVVSLETGKYRQANVGERRV